MQNDGNRKKAKISVLSWSKTEQLRGEEITFADQYTAQSRAKEKVNFIYSSLGKALEKQTKMFEDQGEKQTKAI